MFGVRGRRTVVEPPENFIVRVSTFLGRIGANP